MEKKQCLFPWSKPLGYNKLSPSSSIPENQQPLLDNHCDHYQDIRRLDCETNSNRQDNANLKRRIVYLEDEIVKLRASMEKTESRAELASAQATALETHVLELKSRLDSFTTTQLPLVSIEPEPDMGHLQNQVNMLKRTVNEMNFNNLMNQNGKELENKLTDVTASIADLKLHQENRRPSSEEEEEKTRVIPESIEGYFMILIFLISVLIGATIY